MQIGYALASEEHRPMDLVANAVRAEEAGFDFASISDHYHPWIDNQGQSPFVWAVIGGIAHATGRITIGTGVTCPIMRIHPAIIAHAAATAADMLPGRFYLGVGSGENLNEHILGERWPSADERRDMLEESVALIRELWRGELSSFYGVHFTVTDARLYTVPVEPPPIHIAAAGDRAAELAGRIGDGLIATAPERELVDAFEKGGGAGKPRYGQVTVSWHTDEAEAKRLAKQYWPTSALRGELNTELPLPRHFEQATQDVTEDQLARQIICGADPAKLVEAIQKYAKAGFDHVYIHQVGPDQASFFDAYQREVLPELRHILKAA